MPVALPPPPKLPEKFHSVCYELEEKSVISILETTASDGTTDTGSNHFQNGNSSNGAQTAAFSPTTCRGEALRSQGPIIHLSNHPKSESWHSRRSWHSCSLMALLWPTFSIFLKTLNMEFQGLAVLRDGANDILRNSIRDTRLNFHRHLNV